jgi:hypothetical protein
MREGKMLANGRYAVYHMIPKEDGVHKHLSSVFAIKNGGFHLLEDYADIFTKYHTQDGDQPSRILEQRIHNLLNNSSYYKVIPTKEDNIRSPDSRHKMVTPQDINSGRHVFAYHSPHHNGPSQLVYDKGSFHLNGYPLSIAELKHIKESVEGGTGKVSYPEDMFKAEDNFSAIPEPDDFFDTDYMCPQIGNLHAYRNFVGGEPKGGSHIFLTSDAVKKVLEDDGVKSHNDILIAIATMLDKAASVPDESGRVFHVGHDSYYVYMPSYEAGLQFLYNLQGLINEMPTIYSKHPYFDIGMSDELEEAFNALTQVGEYKEHDGEEGNHVMIHTGNTTRYVSPSDIL